MKMDFSIIKKHPAASIGVVLVGGVLLYFIIGGGGGGSAAASDGMSPYDQQMGLLNAQAGAQYQMAQLSSATSLQSQANAIQAQIAQWTTQATVDTHQSDNALAAALAQISGQSTQANIAAETARQQIAAQQAVALEQQHTQVALMDLQTTANIQMASIMGTTNLGIAAVNASTTQTLAQYQSEVAKAQIKANRDIGVAMSKVAQTNASFGGIGGILSGLGGGGGIASLLKIF